MLSCYFANGEPRERHAVLDGVAFHGVVELEVIYVPGQEMVMALVDLKQPHLAGTVQRYVNSDVAVVLPGPH